MLVHGYDPKQYYGSVKNLWESHALMLAKVTELARQVLLFLKTDKHHTRVWRPSSRSSLQTGVRVYCLGFEG